MTDHSYNIVRVVNPSGIISTFAGNGSYGFSGDGGQATAASLAAPNEVATDLLGNVYIAEVVPENRTGV